MGGRAFASAKTRRIQDKKKMIIAAQAGYVLSVTAFLSPLFFVTAFFAGVMEANQHSVGEAIDRIRELRKGSNLSGLKLKDLIHERHKR